MQNIISEKPTLAQLLNRHQLTMSRIAQAARVRLSTVQAMARHIPMQPTLAQQVLSGLFRLTGVCYRLEDVDVAIIPSSCVVGSLLPPRLAALEECPISTINDS